LTREIPRRLQDATDFGTSSALRAWRALHGLSEELRSDPEIVNAAHQHGTDTASGHLTNVGLVTRDNNGLVRTADDGHGHHFTYEYAMENGQVRRNSRGEPLISSIAVTVNGRTQTFTAEQLMQAGRNSLGHVDAEGVTISQNGDSAGRVNLQIRGGGTASLDFVTRPDGRIVPRINMITESNGSTHVYEYGRANDPTFVTKTTSTVHAFDGTTLVSTNVRVNDTNRFVRTEPNGDMHYITDLTINDRGQMVYRGDDVIDRALDEIFGQSWLTSNDLDGARAHFLELAQSRGIFNGNSSRLQSVIDGIITRCRGQGRVGVFQPTDDQLAAMFRHLSSIFEASSTALQGSALVNGVERCLLSLNNPQEYCNQGQIGSCYLNSLIFLGLMASPDRIAQAFATIVRTGRYRGLAFDNTDLSPMAGQDRFNHIMTTLLGKTFGFRHMTPAFRGTTTSEAQHAYQTIFGMHFPVFSLGSRQNRAAFDAAIARFGGVVALTLDGCHAQVVSRDRNGNYRLENWWNGQGGMEGRISERRLFGN
jgi:hypothetical protein